MRILITGNLGYVGSVLVRHLREKMPNAHLVGYDNGYFAHCLTGASSIPERCLNAQYFGDVRAIPKELFAGMDAVVHLAAVSNDPMGNKFEAVTGEINQGTSLRIAELSRDQGVKNYVFASSCSVYGQALGDARTETDPVNPQTAYAHSKVGTENALAEMDLGDMTVSCLRFATACGMSDRLRLDLVLNDFVACALTSGQITVLSDGTPWRPLIDVRDMARAIEWAACRDTEDGGQLVRINVGSRDWNYQVKDLAEAVAGHVPGTTVSINTNAAPDTRSYKVDFSLFEQLAPEHQPQITLEASVGLLVDGLQRMKFSDVDFRNSPYFRLRVLEDGISAGLLGTDLKWIDSRH